MFYVRYGKITALKSSKTGLSCQTVYLLCPTTAWLQTLKSLTLCHAVVLNTHGVAHDENLYPNPEASPFNFQCLLNVKARVDFYPVSIYWEFSRSHHCLIVVVADQLMRHILILKDHRKSRISFHTNEFDETRLRKNCWYLTESKEMTCHFFTIIKPCVDIKGVRWISILLSIWNWMKSCSSQGQFAIDTVLTECAVSKVSD